MREHNRYYWEGKQQRAEMAKSHTEEMNRRYGEQINECVAKTKIYTGPIEAQNASKTTANVTMRVIETDTITALMNHVDECGRVALLNFASYKHPGGGFVVGSRAQEESLCHESFLYNVLREFEDSYYEPNRNDLNRGLYRNRALYSPNAIFERDGKVKTCDVVTCAAPNFSVAGKFVTRGVNNTALRERVRFVLEIAKAEKVDTFIVGAWGCGVFKQDPKAVAKCFEEECQRVFVDAKINLVFAVIPPLPNQTDNLTPFVKLVQNWKN